MDNHNSDRVSTQPADTPAQSTDAPTQPTSAAPTDVDLRAAFTEAAPNPSASTKARRQARQKSVKLRKASLAVFFIGLAILAAGAGFLSYKLFAPRVDTDAEFLVSVGTWQRKDEPSVVWQFTDLGSGTLTTNAGANQYDFTWTLDDGKLAIDTAWLYTLNNEYSYTLNQAAQTLTLRIGGKAVTFKPAS